MNLAKKQPLNLRKHGELYMRLFPYSVLILKKKKDIKKIISLQIRCSFRMFYVVYIKSKWYFVGKDSLAHSLALTKFCLAHISTTILQECAECSG